MKKALILHGWEGTSKSHWLPWLQAELEKKWYEVIIPDLPNTEYPVIEDQVDFLKKLPLSEERDGMSLKKGDIIIGHSLGCQVWLKYIEQEKLEGLRVIFVAPSYNELANELGENRLGDAFVVMSNAFNTSYSFWNLNKLLNRYTVMLSDDDPYINSFSAKQFYGQLDRVDFVQFEKKWHFNTDAGIMEFPELLESL